MMPFAVVGSTSSHQVGNKNVLGRKTRWGVVEVENDHHCDFIHLRNMIIRFVCVRSLPLLTLQ